jgi:mitogen-activated protein kinase 15
VLDLIGKPKAEDIESMQSPLAWNIINSVNVTKKKSFHSFFPNASEDAIDLLKRLLVFNPNHRISVESALKHRYVAQFSCIEEEISCDHVIAINMDDNHKFSIREYRDALYNDIAKRKKEGITTKSAVPSLISGGSALPPPSEPVPHYEAPVAAAPVQAQPPVAQASVNEPAAYKNVNKSFDTQSQAQRSVPNNNAAAALVNGGRTRAIDKENETRAAERLASQPKDRSVDKTAAGVSSYIQQQVNDRRLSNNALRSSTNQVVYSGVSQEPAKAAGQAGPQPRSIVERGYPYQKSAGVTPTQQYGNPTYQQVSSVIQGVKPATSSVVTTTASSIAAGQQHVRNSSFHPQPNQSGASNYGAPAAYHMRQSSNTSQIAATGGSLASKKKY